MASSRVPSQETDEQQKLRFQVELEFVQCLANPNYLNFLAQRNYFKDQSFVNYLKYLQYWKEAKYAKYLKYPQCLHFLELLQYEHFRKELVNLQCAKFIEDQQILHWQHYQRKRMALLQAQADLATTQQQQQQQQQQAGSGGAGTLPGIGSQLGAGTGGTGCSVSSQPPQTGTIPTPLQPSLNSQSSSLQQVQQVIKKEI